MNSYDIWIPIGCSFNLTLTATDQCNNPLNLSGYSARGGVKYQFSDTGYLLNLSPQIDPSYVSGIVYLSTLAPTGTPITKGVFDVVIYSGSYNLKILRGYANISPEVSTY